VEAVCDRSASQDPRFSALPSRPALAYLRSHLSLLRVRLPILFPDWGTRGVKAV
jgi:hypothetical protein